MFFNFAALMDSALILTLSGSPWGSPSRVLGSYVWILATKVVKLIPHFKRHPTDVIFFGPYVLFAYYHSWIKMRALFTFYDCTWEGRDIAKIDAASRNVSRAGSKAGSQRDSNEEIGSNAGEDDTTEPATETTSLLQARDRSVGSQRSSMGATADTSRKQAKRLTSTQGSRPVEIPTITDRARTAERARTSRDWRELRRTERSA